jgi:hypothetical protein
MEGRKLNNMNPAEMITQFVSTYLDIRRHREANYPDNDAELGRAMQYVYDPKHHFAKMKDLEILVSHQSALFMPALEAIRGNPKLCGSLIDDSNHAVAVLSVCLPYMANLAKEMSQISNHIKQMPEGQFTAAFGQVKSDRTGLALNKSEVADVVARMYGFGVIQQLGVLITNQIMEIETIKILRGQVCSLLNQATQNDPVWKAMLTSCTNETKADEAIKLSGDILAALRVQEPGKANKVVGARIGEDKPAKFGMFDRANLKKLFDHTQKETSALIANPQQVQTSTSLPVTKQERDKVQARQDKIAEELKALAAKEKAKNPGLNRAAEVIQDVNLKTSRELRNEVIAIKEVLAGGVKNDDQLAMLQDIAKNVDLVSLLGDDHDNNANDSLRLSPADAEAFLKIMEDQSVESSVVDEAALAQEAADELKAIPITDAEVARADEAAQHLREMKFSTSSAKIMASVGSSKKPDALSESSNSLNQSSSAVGTDSASSKKESVRQQEDSENNSMPRKKR